MIRRSLIIILLGVAAWQLGGAVWHQGKGWLGQVLMQRAWASANDGVAASPWPGARTRPVARLFVPELKLDRLVMQGTTTPNLAWGPGLETGTAGHILIAAHRDTHFRFLGELQPGHRLELERTGLATRTWQVTQRRVVDSRTTGIDLDAQGPLLSLVTCYPIDAAAAGGPLRLVVSARPIDGPQFAQTDGLVEYES